MEAFIGLCTRCEGLLLTRVRLGAVVEAGEHLCSIVNIYGDTIPDRARALCDIRITAVEDT